MDLCSNFLLLNELNFKKKKMFKQSLITKFVYILAIINVSVMLKHQHRMLAKMY